MCGIVALVRYRWVEVLLLVALADVAGSGTR